MRPFLLLSSRADAVAAEDEYTGFQKATGLDEGELHRVRLEATALPALDLDRYAGILLGGGPFNSSDPPDQKSAVQHRVEADLRTLLDEVVARDFPFLGACYGIGTLGVHQGGVVDRTYAEPIGRVPITLTEAGLADPLLAGMPNPFDAFVGHKEACTVLPPTAVLLAESPRCPVQMFRVKHNVYATQFHPELDRAGIITRVRVYQHAGYFPPHEMDELIERLTQAVVTQPSRVLTNFVARYA
ncbi:MAG TPA: glutamine amidotransferase [Actinomycetales bacterium]|nr:glutamine amidotransferase [Actinomycetales bacterium]